MLSRILFSVCVFFRVPKGYTVVAVGSVCRSPLLPTYRHRHHHHHPPMPPRPPDLETDGGHKRPEMKYVRLAKSCRSNTCTNRSERPKWWRERVRSRTGAPSRRGRRGQWSQAAN